MGRPRATIPPMGANRPSIAELRTARKSMLGGESLPIGYSTFNRGSDIIEELTDPQEDSRVARMTIVWDQPFSGLEEVERILDEMRSYGAAMIEKVELVQR